MKRWSGKVVVVTGGSAGLGRSIASTFAHAGATTILLARDESRLSRARDWIDPENDLPVHSIVCDVCDTTSIQDAVTTIRDQFGRIDVWVNNVGVSIRTRFDECPIDEYQRLMEINFMTAVRCSYAVLPLISQSSGSIVNIGSLAAKTGWKNVSPYATSKHALAAFSHQLRLEGPANVHTLFVCCGPIKRNDEGTRYADASSNVDEQAQSAGAGVRLKGIDPDVLSSRIEVAVRKRKKELMIPWYARILFAIQQLSPTIGDWMLSKFNRSKSKNES
ncbi:MAG: SDR family NAD(P)-dependent oxidoreductase [Planctomycetota bacterium]